MRHLFSVVVAAASVGLLATPAARADHGKMSAEKEKCLKACVDCAKECEACVDHCASLLSQGKKDHLTTLKTCADCGDVCALAAKVIARNGALSAQVCEGCAKACDACAAECDKHAADPMMKKCAEACKACAQACRDMLKHGGHG